MNAQIESLRDKVLNAVAAGNHKTAVIAAAVYGRKPEAKEYDQVWYAIWTLTKEGKLVKGEKRTVSLADAVAAAAPTLPTTNGESLPSTEPLPFGVIRSETLEGYHERMGETMPVIQTEHLTGEVLVSESTEQLATNELPSEPTQFDENPAEQQAIEGELERMEVEAAEDDKAEVDPATRVVLVLKGQTEPIGRAAIVENSGLTVHQVKHVLAKLKEEGKVVMVGTGSLTKWQIQA